MNRPVSEGDRLSMRNEGTTLGQKWRRWWRELPRRVRSYGPDVCGWAAGLGVFAWEARNATLGFEQLWRPGIIWAGIGAIAVAFAVVFLVHIACEDVGDSFKKEVKAEGKAEVKFWSGVGKMVLGVAAFLVLLFGIWSNLAADSIRRGNHQIETSDERTAILKNIRSLEGQVRALPLTLDTGLEADREALQNVLNIGRQWDLPKLDTSPGGDCDQDLKPYPRSLCNQATDLRSDISAAEKAIATRDALNLLLEQERAKLVDEVDSDGVEHLQEMAAMMGEGTEWKMLSNIFTLLASAILGALGAFILHIMIERGQNRKGA